MRSQSKTNSYGIFKSENGLTVVEIRHYKVYSYPPVYMVTITKIGGSWIVSGIFYTRKLDFFVSAFFVRNSPVICAFRTNAREVARDDLRVEKIELVRN